MHATAAETHDRLGARALVRLFGRQSWLSKGLRRRVVDAICPPHAERFETSAFGGSYSGRLDSYIDRELYFFGAYEPDVLSVLDGLARHRPQPVLLDVGANVGHHSLFAARRYAEVHAFEPYPPLVALLGEQVARNRLTHVHVHAVGLGDEDGNAEYAAPADNRAGYGGFDNLDPNLERFVLPMRRGDTYLASIPVERVDVIKIDVEGSERRVVKGLSRVISTCRPAILMEYWPDTWSQPVAELFPTGYQHWWLRTLGAWGVIFNRDTPLLAPLAQAPPGSMLLSMPEEWPVPDGVAIGEPSRVR